MSMLAADPGQNAQSEAEAPTVVKEAAGGCQATGHAAAASAAAPSPAATGVCAGMGAKAEPDPMSGPSTGPRSTGTMAAGEGSGLRKRKGKGNTDADYATVPTNSTAAPSASTPLLFPSKLYAALAKGGRRRSTEAEERYAAWVCARMWPALHAWHMVMCVVGLTCVVRGLMSGRTLQDAPAILLLTCPFATLAISPLHRFKAFWLGQGHLLLCSCRALGLLLPTAGLLPWPTVFNVSSHTGVDMLVEVVVTCFFMSQV